MQRIVLIAVSSRGVSVARRLSEAFLNAPIYSTVRAEGVVQVESVGEAARVQFGVVDGIVFVGALGICVRAIAPLLMDKHCDPAVVCVDSMGQYAIAVASGHVGGGNELTRRVARLLGAQSVVTTQSDGLGLWALDTLAAQYGWREQTVGASRNEIISLYVDQCQTLLLLEARDRGTDYLESSLAGHVHVVYTLDGIDLTDYALLIAVTPRVYAQCDIPALYFRPPMLHLGVGCRRDADAEGVWQAIESGLLAAGFSPLSVASVATVEAKRNEPLLHALCAHWDVPLRVYGSDDLVDVEVPNPSTRVQEAVGTSSVSEASALCAAEATSLLLEKQKGCVSSGSDFTYALAAAPSFERRGHVEIVGAGPGDVDLISIRGRHFIERADLLLYAGSLVSEQHARYVKPGAVVRSSADMALSEQFALIKKFYDAGRLVVRLHTGDPSIYGAIGEQMALFDRAKMQYHITPGISSFQAAAAALSSQLTIPGEVQTVVLTRGPGRTPTPEREQLRALARSRSTMCIFLSAGLVEQVQAQLLEEYPPDTPVAVCHRVSWPDERIDCGELHELATLVGRQGSTLTTLLVVGRAVGNRRGESFLYAPSFGHLYRKETE